MGTPVVTMSTTALRSEAHARGTEIAALQGRLASLTGELDRRRGWHDDGATSMGAWLTERNGVSERTGRMLAQVGERLWELPSLSLAFEAGTLSFDKVRAVVGFITPETDAEVTALAGECTVRQLYALARTKNGPSPDSGDARYARFNDAKCTVTARLSEVEYAQVRLRIEEVARGFASDGETRWDQRCADALAQICSTAGQVRSSGRHLVVVHVDLAMLQGQRGIAELERFGLISPETARRLLCDGDVVLAVDDTQGHTMCEGRARRLPSDTQRREVMRRDRHCRFPGCSNVTFTNVHHVVHWERGGLTDLENLVLLCEHHHHRVHELGWKVSGDANVLLTIVTPSGRSMQSRPSPQWTTRAPPTG